MIGWITQKYEDYRNLPFFEQFRDVRAIGLVLFLLAALIISWSGLRVIQTNYELQKRIAELRQQNQVAELTNANLRLKNQYLESNDYLELSARQNFGLGLPGERLLIVPDDVARRNAAQTPGEARPTPRGEQPFYQRNFQSWMNFFLNRQG